MDDLISRQAAIDAINSWRGRFSEEYNEAIDDCENSIKELSPAQYVATDTNVGDTISRQAALDAVEKNACNTQRIMDAVNNLPPAQPETLTDKEQRIFLAAMGREEKVCRQVDDECGDCRDSDSLVRTCHEITRKVKGTLWT